MTIKDAHINDILNKYSTMIYRIAYARTHNRYDSEDIMQDVFLKYIRRGKRFDDPEHEKAWFIRATIDRSSSLLSSAWFRRTLPEDKSIASTDEVEESDVFYALSKLSPPLRTLIHLYYYEDMKVREIAEMLGKSESYVKSALARARKKLKIELEDEYV